MFDPYHKWLGILPKDQPPNHYRLLGLELYESDLDVIEGAADRAMGFIRNYQSGEYAAQAAKLLNEIATARLCLLRPASKSEYDAKLRKQLAVSEAAKDESPAFAIDAEMAELLKSPKRSPKSKRKKVKSSQGVLIAGGAGVGACVLLLFLFMSRGPKPALKIEPLHPALVESSSSQVPLSKSKPSTQTGNEANVVSLVESKLIAEPAGPPVDLIQAVELPRDRIVGDWKKEGTSLVGSDSGKIYLPARVPEDYQLKFTVKRITGNDTLIVGYIMAGQQGMVAFDGYRSEISGMYLDGRGPKENCTTRSGALFENDRLSTIIMTVHPGHLIATVDEKVVIDWYGEPVRLIYQSEPSVPNRESPFLVISQSVYRIESAIMIPLKPEPQPARIARLASSTDVMPLLDTERDGKRGIWALNKNVLNSPDSFGLFSLPIAVPEEYTLSALVELPQRSPPDATLVIGLLAGKSYCTIVMRNGDCLGLEKIDGARWNGNATRLTGNFLVPGKLSKIACTVTKHGLRMEYDDRTLVNWRGDLQRLSPQDDWVSADCRKLSFGSLNHFKIRDIKVGPPIDPPPLPDHPPIAIGMPVDLLALIEPKRDALAGTWTKEGSEIRSMGDVGGSKLVIPCEVPAEYKLTIRVARESEGVLKNEALILNLPSDSSMANLFLDAYSSTISGINIDRLGIEHPSNSSSRRLQAISPGEAQEIVVIVRKTGMKVTNGDKTVIDWTGTANRWWMHPEWSIPSGRIAICSHHGRFRFEKLEIEPLEPSSFSPVAALGDDGNLLAIIDPARDSRNGQWAGNSDGIESPILEGARLRIPIVPPTRYVLTADVERKQGVEDFSLGLIVGGRTCDVMIDGRAQSVAGLGALDGQGVYDTLNLTRRNYREGLLPPGTRVQIRYFVLPDFIVVKYGDQEIVRWHGDSRRLSQQLHYLPPNGSETDRLQLWLGAWKSKFLIRELTLKPLSDAEATKIADSFSGVFPMTSQADVPVKSIADSEEKPVPADSLGEASLNPAEGGVFLFINTNSGRCLSVENGGIRQGPFVRDAGLTERWKVVATGDCFKLINQKSGKVLAISQGSKNQGHGLIEWQDLNSGDQKWEFVKVGNHYSIKSCHSQLVVGVAGGAKEEGARVLQWGMAQIPDQIWRAQRVSGTGKKKK